MRLVIIESPFAGSVKENIDYARRCVRDSLGRGEALGSAGSFCRFVNPLSPG